MAQDLRTDFPGLVCLIVTATGCSRLNLLGRDLTSGPIGQRQGVSPRSTYSWIPAVSFACWPPSAEAAPAYAGFDIRPDGRVHRYTSYLETDISVNPAEPSVDRAE